jgi:hypothetical protein
MHCRHLTDTTSIEFVPVDVRFEERKRDMKMSRGKSNGQNVAVKSSPDEGK